MNIKREKLLLIIALIISATAAIWIYILGFSSSPGGAKLEYIVTSVMYIFGLIAIRGIWKLTLEQKISSKNDQE